MVDDLAAIAYLMLTVAAVGFHIALALGAPWGELTMGGRHPGVLPPVLRLVAAGQAIILSLLAFIVLSRAGLVLPEATADSPMIVWFPVVVSGFSAWLNLTTPSRRERRIWAPVTIAMFVASLVVAISTSGF